MNKLIKIIGVVVLIVAAYFLAVRIGILPNLNKGEGPVQNIVKKLPGGEFNLDQSKAKIDLSNLRQGCPVKDCIPAIDNPKFISGPEAERLNQIKDDDVVFAISYKDVNRAYSQRILNWHEIVNDTIAEDPIMVTFCPLCGTAIGYERPADTTFGVSGKLVNSNLVMYDRKTDTLWQQLGGEAIVGELVGQKLKPFPVDTLFWKDWKKLHPDTQILSQETGYSRNYDLYPYGSYETDRSVYFPAEGESDTRLHPKEIVWGVEIDDKFKAYSDKKLAETGTLTETFNGVELNIVRSKEGQVRITRVDGIIGKQQIIPDRAMWFAWVSFHPKTDLFK